MKDFVRAKMALFYFWENRVLNTLALLVEGVCISYFQIIAQHAYLIPSHFELSFQAILNIGPVLVQPV